MNEIRTITATEFKAKCLDLPDQLADHRLAQLSVTKRGRVVAVITPPADKAAEVRQLYGFLREQAIIPPGLDLTAPVWDGPLPGDDDSLHG